MAGAHEPIVIRSCPAITARHGTSAPSALTRAFPGRGQILGTGLTPPAAGRRPTGPEPGTCLQLLP